MISLFAGAVLVLILAFVTPGIYFMTKSFGGTKPGQSLMLMYAVYGLTLLDGVDQWGSPYYQLLSFVIIPIILFAIWSTCMVIHARRDR